MSNLRWRETTRGEPFTMIPLWVLRTVSKGAAILYAEMAHDCDFANGEVLVTQDTLSQAVKASTRQVQRWLTELQAAGALEIIQNGLNKPNLYVLTWLQPSIHADTTPMSYPDTTPMSCPKYLEQEQEQEQGPFGNHFVIPGELEVLDLEPVPSETTTTEDVKTSGEASQEPLWWDYDPREEQNPSSSPATQEKASATGLLRIPQVKQDAWLLCCRLEAHLRLANFKPLPRITEGWERDMEYLLRIDGRSRREVEDVLGWLEESRTEAAAFWRPNIRSPFKLRQHFDQLSARRQLAYRNGAGSSLSLVEKFREEEA